MWLEIPAADIIMFLVDVYCAASDSAEHGRMTTAQLANYRQFCRILKVYWQPIFDEVQQNSRESATDSRQASLPLRPTAKLQRFRIQWEKLGYLLDDSTYRSNFWSEREMLGCFNVECVCYGQKALHKLRECKRCQTAQYCNKGCQRK